MNFLTTIPIWVYFVILALTFMAVHVFTFRPRSKLTRTSSILLRVGSSVVLLLGLMAINPSDPGSILLALVAAGAGGFMSGRSASPPTRAAPAAGGTTAASAGDRAESGPPSDERP